MRFQKTIHNFFGHSISIYLTKTPNIPTIGITNETEDSYFVPFIDYDNIAYEKVLADLRHLHRVFGLCFFLVLQSKNNEDNTGNYAVMGIDKLPYHLHKEMLTHTRCDSLYITTNSLLHRKNWVLRIGGKGKREAPTLKDILRFNSKCKYEHSTAHREFYTKFYDIYIPENTFPSCNWDKYHQVEIIEYQTAKP